MSLANRDSTERAPCGTPGSFAMSVIVDAPTLILLLEEIGGIRDGDCAGVSSRIASDQRVVRER